MFSLKQLSHLALVTLVVLAYPKSTDAVSLQIVDRVVPPGDGAVAFLQVVVNPEGQTIDGLQFGVEVDGGATVASVSFDRGWTNLVTRGMDTQVAINTAVTGGHTWEVDLDPENQFSFSGMSPFMVAQIRVQLPAGTLEGDTFTVSFTSDLGTPSVATGFFTSEVFNPVVSTQSGTIFVSEISRDFDVAGPADLLTSGPWDPVGLPQRSDKLWIRNGGIAEAASGRLEAADLAVGDAVGSGTMNLTNTDVDLTDELDIVGRDILLEGTQVIT